MRQLYLVACLAFALLAMPQNANAQAFWVDYSWEVAPQNEKRFVKAVNKFTSSDAFKKFNGKMWFNVHVANGADPTTHSFAVVHESIEDFERLSAYLAGSADWDKFRKALAAAGTRINETTYSHVIGYGDHPKDKRAFMGQVLQVRDPANYVRSLNSFMKARVMADLPGALDIWQVVSGGPPGATHLVVFGYDSFSEGVNFTASASRNPEFLRNMGNLAQYRSILGSIWVTAPVKFGPSELSDMR